MENHGRISKFIDLTKNMKVEKMILLYPNQKTELMNCASWLLEMGNKNLRGPFTDLVEVPKHTTCK